jgi:hypothetical protein
MADGVAGHVDHAGELGADGEAAGLGQGKVERRQAVGIGGGTKDHRPGRRAQLFDARDVVVVVVGDENVGQRPAARLQCGKDRGCIRHVDHRRLARGGIMDQIGVVVGPAEEGHKFKGHGLCTDPGYGGQGLTTG